MARRKPPKHVVEVPTERDERAVMRAVAGIYFLLQRTPSYVRAITTVRMLVREHENHEVRCGECASRPWHDHGDISAVPPPYAARMSCGPCHVEWRGCADAFECPVCGYGEPPWMPSEMGP